MTTPLRHIGALTIALTIALGANFAYSAWSSPTGAPPSNNVEAPINTGTVDQVKNGGLSVDALSVVGDAVLTGSLDAADGVTGNEISIGECTFGTCSWPMETINLPDTRNLRINFGDTQGYLLGNSGQFEAATVRLYNDDGGTEHTNLENDNGVFSVRSGLSEDLRVYRDGRIGANQYCDIDGTNCFLATDVDGTGGGAGGDGGDGSAGSDGATGPVPAAGAVGSLVFAALKADIPGGVEVDYGFTVNGSSLCPAGLHLYDTNDNDKINQVNCSDSLSGVWMSLGNVRQLGGPSLTYNGGRSAVTLFQRVADDAPLSNGYVWATGAWQGTIPECSNGYQYRSIWCEDIDGNTVSDSLCSGAQPDDRQWVNKRTGDCS